MRVFPEYNGAMADWPEVAAVPGVREALGRLQANYALLCSHECGAFFRR